MALCKIRILLKFIDNLHIDNYCAIWSAKNKILLDVGTK